MSDVTILHNKKCSTSRFAMDTADELGADVETVLYLQDPLDEAQLRRLLEGLEDPPADLVRKDKRFGELGLDADDYTDVDSVVALLLEHHELMQRPVLVKGDLDGDGPLEAIIGRPKDRVASFLQG